MNANLNCRGWRQTLTLVIAAVVLMFVLPMALYHLMPHSGSAPAIGIIDLEWLEMPSYPLDALGETLVTVAVFIALPFCAWMLLKACMILKGDLKEGAIVAFLASATYGLVSFLGTDSLYSGLAHGIGWFVLCCVFLASGALDKEILRPLAATVMTAYIANMVPFCVMLYENNH